MFWARVPEATVNEYRESLSRKNKIWFATKSVVAAPASHTMGTKNSCELQFRILVSFGSDSRHH
jgi:hypothetical protein